MKRLLTFAVIVASSAYYACLPFLVARAVTTTTAPLMQAESQGDLATSTVLYMRVTAYASVPDETDNTPFIMADGHHVYDGAAASNILPFGTKIMIPSLFGSKVFTIEDRMSQKIKNTIDIWMPSVGKAIFFGANHADIVVLQDAGDTTSSLAVAK